MVLYKARAKQISRSIVNPRSKRKVFIMERWAGKVAVVTGASAGIGAAIAVDLTKHGLIVIGLARRKEKVEALKQQVVGAKGQLHAYECDVSNEKSVHSAFDWIEKTFKRINILVNNAGVSLKTTILGDSKMEDLKRVIDTNVVGLLYCTRAAHKVLIKTGEPGHIVNISSITGHSVPSFPPPNNAINVYPGTKHCVRAISEVLRQELMHISKQVRISMISPGLVDTEIFEAGGYDRTSFLQMPSLQSEDISAACLYILGTPPHVQIHDLIIKPVGEMF